MVISEDKRLLNLKIPLGFFFTTYTICKFVLEPWDNIFFPSKSQILSAFKGKKRKSPATLLPEFTTVKRFRGCVREFLL